MLPWPSGTRRQNLENSTNVAMIWRKQSPVRFNVPQNYWFARRFRQGSADLGAFGGLPVGHEQDRSAVGIGGGKKHALALYAS